MEACVSSSCAVPMVLRDNWFEFAAHKLHWNTKIVSLSCAILNLCFLTWLPTLISVWTRGRGWYRSFRRLIVAEGHWKNLKLLLGFAKENSCFRAQFSWEATDQAAVQGNCLKGCPCGTLLAQDILWFCGPVMNCRWDESV